jgi:hypothetical protein
MALLTYQWQQPSTDWITSDVQAGARLRLEQQAQQQSMALALIKQAQDASQFEQGQQNVGAQLAALTNYREMMDQREGQKIAISQQEANAQTARYAPDQSVLNPTSPNGGGTSASSSAQPGGATVSGSVFGLVPDGRGGAMNDPQDSVDAAKGIRGFNPAAGAWGANIKDPTLQGVAVTPQMLASAGVDLKNTPVDASGAIASHVAQVTMPDGTVKNYPIVDKLGTPGRVDFTYGAWQDMGGPNARGGGTIPGLNVQVVPRAQPTQGPAADLAGLSDATTPSGALAGLAGVPPPLAPQSSMAQALTGAFPDSPLSLGGPASPAGAPINPAAVLGSPGNVPSIASPVHGAGVGMGANLTAMTAEPSMSQQLAELARSAVGQHLSVPQAMTFINQNLATRAQAAAQARVQSANVYADSRRSVAETNADSRESIADTNAAAKAKAGADPTQGLDFNPEHGTYVKDDGSEWIVRAGKLASYIPPTVKAKQLFMGSDGKVYPVGTDGQPMVPVPDNVTLRSAQQKMQTTKDAAGNVLQINPDGSTAMIAPANALPAGSAIETYARAVQDAQAKLLDYQTKAKAIADNGTSWYGVSQSDLDDAQKAAKAAAADLDVWHRKYPGLNTAPQPAAPVAAPASPAVAPTVPAVASAPVVTRPGAPAAAPAAAVAPTSAPAASRPALSPIDQKAITWALANPADPMAAAILKKNGY